jgi:flagellar hook protein FlgE
MSLASVLQTARSGMSAAEMMVHAAGNNLANSQTVGFKSRHVMFASQAARTVRAGERPNGRSGGSNPLQIGLGVRVAGTSTDLTHGAMVPSGELSNTDIGQNLVDLTLASLQFRTNADVFRTAGGLLDELVNLGRARG